MTAPGTNHVLVDADGLVRIFGSRRALDGVSLKLSAGECLALFGPNGAGKTTLLRTLAGLLKPSRGTARIDGVLVTGGHEARAKIGLISHHTMLYGALTVRENVEFTAKLYGIRDVRAAADRALRRLGVVERADTPVRFLSRGWQQRASIARAVVHEPRVLLADEPYNGLDAAGAASLTGLLRELRHDGAALVVVTHHLADGLALATQAAILVDGKFVRHDARASLDPAAYAAAYNRLVAGDAA